MLTAQRRATRSGHRLSLVLLLCAVTLGILGMHGLALHGTASLGESSAPLVQAVDDTGLGDGLGAEVAAVSTAAEHHPESGGEASLMALCLIVLTGIAGAALWMRWRRSGGWRVPGSAFLTRLGSHVAVPPPPFFRHLTILRI